MTVIAAQVLATLCFTDTYDEQDIKGTVSGSFNPKSDFFLNDKSLEFHNLVSHHKF